MYVEKWKLNYSKADRCTESEYCTGLLGVIAQSTSVAINIKTNELIRDLLDLG
jgi:hypothetical protein